MKTASKKERPVPKKCICGKGGVTVKSRFGTMVSCPNPIQCEGNFRTQWRRNEELAIVEWNSLVESHKFRKVSR